MKTLFKLIFTTTTGKGLVALATGLITAAAFVTMPPLVIGIASGISTIGMFYGINVAHNAPPPVNSPVAEKK